MRHMIEEDWHNDGHSRAPPPDAWQLRLVPTVADIASRLARQKAHKAVGEDGAGPELARMAAWTWAAALHPILVKATLRMDTPIQWNGGPLASPLQR